ncbi:CHAT domain-containing protein [Streptomyces sp. NPDC001530]|uniref:CHAT domain-containing protein n=1 Tax=Streptomyces sp. NPDC001530 TaxID=3364582 RepID=UPI00367761CD
MTELQDRVVARLVAAQNARDAAPLRGEDAVGDALALLREAAPSPEEAIDLDAIAAVCWTFWLRHQGSEDPDAQRNVLIALSTFGFLCPRAPAGALLPQPLRDSFDPADTGHEARFAYLVSSAYGDAVGSLPDLAEADRLTALDRALAWCDTALQLLPEDHEGFVELTFHALGLGVTRFELAADPDALAEAARHAGVLCERLRAVGVGAVEGAAGAEGGEAAEGAASGDVVEVGAIALGTLLDAARLLGEPSLAEVERLVAAAPEGALTPEAAEGLRFLRELHAEPVAWPGEQHLRVGSVIADAGVREHDAGRIACGVRRLRAALAHTPADHPAHPVATAALSQALAAFAEERGDDAAAREATRLLATVDVTRVVNDSDAELLSAVQGLAELVEDDDPARLQNAGPLLGHLVEQLRERAASGDGDSATDGAYVPDIDLEILDILGALVGETAVVSDDRIARYRAALAGLPADQPRRHAYVAVLAALTGAHGQALQETEPARSAQLAADSRSLTDEVAADAPDGFLPLGLLRRGLFDAALPVALATVHADVPDGSTHTGASTGPGGTIHTGGPTGPGGPGGAAGGDDAADLRDLAKMVSLLSRLDDVRLDDPAHLGDDIEVMRELLADTEGEDPSLRAYLAASLGSALSSQAAVHGDPARLDEVVSLLRYARSHAPDLPGGLDQILASALTSSSLGRFDPEAAREAAALLASAAAERAAAEGASVEGTATEGAPVGGTAAEGAPVEGAVGDGLPVEGAAADGLAAEGAPADLDMAVLSARTEFFNAMGNYVLGHEPGQLARARDLAQRLTDLTARAAARAGNRPPGLDVMGDALTGLIDSIGPGGGPRPGITDDQVEQCRRTFAVCPAGHPMRLFTASTLMRVLTQRAVAVRAADPESAARLVAEAAEVVRSVEAEAPADWADMMRTFIGVIGAGRLPPISSEQPPAAPTEAPPQTAANAVDAMMATLRTRLSGSADATSLRDPMLPVWFRAHGEIGAAAGAVGRERLDLALDHLEAAVEAMADVTDRGSDQQSAEHGLTAFEGDIRSIIELVLMVALGREAADGARALASELRVALEEKRLPDTLPEPGALFRTVAGPDVDRATELLERGRGLLLSRRIEARADIGDLRSAHPALADEFERLTDRLAAEPEAAAEPGAPDPAAAPGHAEWSRLARLRASRELDDLVDRIRTRPGFDDFLRPLTAEQLRSLAADGPIVVLNHARRHCHALVVTARSITALRLEAASDEITDTARRLVDAVDAINAHGTSRPSPAQLIAAGATVRETLAWTWHKIVCPVLDLVGSYDPVPDGGQWPRIWWVPTGAFNALPLHAAQCTLPDCPLNGCGAALDTVVSSYVPGFQTLAYARTRAESRDDAGARHQTESGRDAGHRGDAGSRDPAESGDDAGHRNEADHRGHAGHRPSADFRDDTGALAQAESGDPAGSPYPAGSREDAGSPYPAGSREDAGSPCPAGSHEDAGSRDPAESGDDAGHRDEADHRGHAGHRPSAEFRDDAGARAESGDPAGSPCPAGSREDAGSRDPAESGDDVGHRNEADHRGHAGHRDPAESRDDAEGRDLAESGDDVESRDLAESRGDAERRAHADHHAHAAPRAHTDHRDPGAPTSPLLVAAPEDELPGVAAAACYVAGLLGAPAPLVGAAATREAVLAALGATPWAHFGCHAATDPTEPSGALLHLPSGEPLSVLEICRARPRSARLAFLAACGTARTAERLSDEAIHITSAFLLAGFPTAVGTLWEIDSTHADHVTRDFYRRLTATPTAGPAHALHHTVRELRRRIPDRPHIWAAYVHAGT